MLTVATWNINGVKARIDSLTRWLEECAPDVVCLQEIKSQDETFPGEAIERLGYNVATHGQKGFNGVALLSKRPLEDVTRRLPGDEAAFARLAGHPGRLGLVISKLDTLKNAADVADDITHWSPKADWAFVVPLAARRRTNLDALRGEIRACMPDGPMLYPEHQVRGYDLAFAVSEIVREKLIGRLRDEVPHALTVETENIESEEGVTRIAAVIWVEREGQKRIVIGDKGAVLKRVGTQARKELEPMVGERVFLKLWVRVKPGWSDDERALQTLGIVGR